MIHKFVYIFFCLSFFACANQTFYHVVQTDIDLFCCKRINFRLQEFNSKSLQSIGSTSLNKTVSATILHLDNLGQQVTDTFKFNCKEDAFFKIELCNNSESDVYFPISNELRNDTITIIPWRLLSNDTLPIRIARLTPFSDMVDEPSGAVLNLTKLKQGKKINLVARIKPEWLCMMPAQVTLNSLSQELNSSKIYAASRAAKRAYKPNVQETLQTSFFRYDVAFTKLEFLKDKNNFNLIRRNDTTFYHFKSKEKPETFFEKSYSITESNKVIFHIS